MFAKTIERFREDYDIAVAMVAPPQTAARFGYELRLFDEAGFAYRGPLLSVAVPRESFWTQVNSEHVQYVQFLTVEQNRIHPNFLQGFHMHIPNIEVLGSFYQTTVRIFERD